MSVKVFVFSCLLLVILAHGRTEFHKKDLQLQPNDNDQEQKSPRFRSVAVQKAKIEPVTMCVLAVAGVLVKAGGLIIQGTHELKVGSSGCVPEFKKDMNRKLEKQLERAN